MPLYDFECDSCSAKFEELEKEDILFLACPRCPIGVAERLVSAPKIGGVAAAKIKDRAMRGGASATGRVSVTVPRTFGPTDSKSESYNNYKKNNNDGGKRDG